eukprot:CAMPEP_0203966556 /NCGR_PEP_ID=MMETSP0359-20131031/95757_1 /ASSEMBLY_ACC=CAM_ASM_000338 /TAXON_ID=268821 /ORGANISM="Scrippsiella Hangoei, Strain SHTV-5" /LENGTH=67 /DNA_ID=CAMNT_0050903983 /DNA_START=11 /DNA_END=210 /DNA_ORIENTATION=-
MAAHTRRANEGPKIFRCCQMLGSTRQPSNTFSNDAATTLEKRYAIQPKSPFHGATANWTGAGWIERG